MNNYEEYNTTLNYLLASALDDLEQEDCEYCLDRHETELIETYVHDNDCDIINELIDCMKEQIRDKVEEIIESRNKVFSVCFNITTDINLDIKAHNEEELEEIINDWGFKNFLLDYLDASNVDIEIDHAEETEPTEYFDCNAEDYIS